MRDRRSVALAECRWAATVAVGVATPCLLVLLAGRTLSWRDTSSLFEPMRPLIATALRGLRLPLWNPYEGTGGPLFAQLLHGVLHPWSVLAAFLVPGGGMDLMIVLHVVTGAVGAGALSRGVGASPAGATVAGLGYGLSGYLLGLSANIQYLAAAGTAPWAMLTLRRAGDSRLASVAAAAIAVAVLVFAGDPQWALVASALGLVLAIEAHGLRRAWRAALAVMLGAGLAAVQLVPAWMLLSESSRRGGLVAADRTQWALNPARLLELVVPGFFAGLPGPSPAPVFLWLDAPSQYPLPFLQSVFIGLPVLLCAAWGIRASRTARWCTMAAGVLLWMALGHRAFAVQLLDWIPVWGAFRYAEKLVGPFTLLIAVVAGLGVGPFATRGLDRLRPVAARGAIGLFAVACLAFVVWRAGSDSSSTIVWPLVVARLGVGAALAGGAMGLLTLARDRNPDADTSAGVREHWIVALVLATGLLAAPAALHAGRRDARDPEPLAWLRRATAVPRVIHPVDQIALPVARGFDMFDAAQVVKSSVGRPPYNVPSRIDSFDTYSGLVPHRYRALLGQLETLGPARWAAFRRFAVTHAAITPAYTPTDAAAAEAATAGGLEVWRGHDGSLRVFGVPHRPWAHFAPEVREAGSAEGALDLTVALTARGDAATVLEGPAPPVLGEGSVESVERHVERVRVVAEAPNGGLLVIADAWWPGWIARIDGQGVPIMRADAILRAVAWPAGRHVLEMEYRPHEVQLGLTVSLAAALVLAGLLVAGRHRPR